MDTGTASPEHPDEVRIVLDAATARALLDALAAAVPVADGPLHGEPLTPREEEVMRCLSQGKGYGQIAAELFIELETVRTHARRVRRKLGVATSRELRGLEAPVRDGREQAPHALTSPLDHLPPPAPRL